MQTDSAIPMLTGALPRSLSSHQLADLFGSSQGSIQGQSCEPSKPVFNPRAKRGNNMHRRTFLAASALVGLNQAFSSPLAMAEGSVSGSSKSKVEDRLADFALGYRYENLPPDIVKALKRLVLDTLGIQHTQQSLHIGDFGS